MLPILTLTLNRAGLPSQRGCDLTGLFKNLQPYSPHWTNHGSSGARNTLTLPVSSTTNATLLFLGGVPQLAGSDYTISGTTLSLTSTLADGIEAVSCILYDLGSVTTPAAGSVNFASLGFTSQAQGDILYRDSSTWARLPAGTSGQFLKTQGTGANPTWGTVSAGFTLSSEQATTSGSSVTFGSIPAGTKMIIVNLAGVSTNGTGGCGVQIGDAGGLETSGYAGRSTIAEGGGTVKNFSDHFEFGFLNAGDIQQGQFILTLQDASDYTWACTFTVAVSGQNVWDGGGSKSLSAELTQVALRTDDTFDAGAASIMYI